MNLPFSCQSYEELNGPDEVYDRICNGKTIDTVIIREQDWLIQLKYDGIWGLVIIENNKYEIYSKTGQLKKASIVGQTTMSLGKTILVGEFMYGSQWSTNPERAGKVFVFDCLVCEGRDLSTLPYKDRYRAAVSQVLLFGQPFNILPCYSISKLGEFWLSLREKTEGFIIRRWSDSWDATLFKLKFEVEDDFVVMGILDGKGKHEGRMGALMLGQYNEGQLEYVMDCGGGFTDEQREWWRKNYYVQREENNRVVQIKGKGRFNTGALRHPNFVRIRDDKLPQDCILKKEQSR